MKKTIKYKVLHINSNNFGLLLNKYIVRCAHFNISI